MPRLYHWPRAGRGRRNPHLYRQLAASPKANYPTQIEEIGYVVRWLFDHVASTAQTRPRSAAAATSAGGNMTCVIALKLRGQNGPRVAIQVPLFPHQCSPTDTLSASEAVPGSTSSPAVGDRLAPCARPFVSEHVRPDRS